MSYYIERSECKQKRRLDTPDLNKEKDITLALIAWDESGRGGGGNYAITKTPPAIDCQLNSCPVQAECLSLGYESTCSVSFSEIFKQA
ncbi:hypothetical protein J6590_027809 [Homalodisca vitripennis]|nr:hypothetical protein J6590_027809 [Homalodisca vitripennis]